MYCYQCEQTKNSVGCNGPRGVCGKEEIVADLQDVLVYLTKGISMYAYRAGTLNERDEEIDLFVIEALFATVTNVDFDKDRFLILIKKAFEVKDKAKKLYEKACEKNLTKAEKLYGPALENEISGLDNLLKLSKKCSFEKAKEKFGDDIAGLLYLILLGLKGAAAYLDHAYILDKKDKKLFFDFHETLNFLTKEKYTQDEVLQKSLETGEINLRVMKLLDEAHTSTFGNPIPTKVRITPKKGKAILVSGHDLKDLEELLKQTKGLGINVYTHGEMLPAHGYPLLKKYPHLAGNYGSAWQLQKWEFDSFPGSILMTTNCLIEPNESYKDRIFSKGLVGWPEVKHIKDYDFKELIEKASQEKGFEKEGEEKYITVGFGHNTVINLADNIVEKVKSGKIKHFFFNRWL